MNASLKKVSLVALLAAFAAPAAFAAAGQGTVTFNGNLTDSTCTLDGLDANNNLNVALPTISTKTLAAAGNTAGATMFQLKVKDCSADVTKVAAHFETTNLETVSRGAKNLKDGVTGGATKVAVQLLDGDGTTVLNLGTKGSPVTVTSGAATMYYGGRYYALGQTTAGAVQSVVTFTLAYN